ncbi:hypothetical protein R5R35_005557 [Gryllus longicercus]|uniref:Peptidase C2 calpain domain-containing protein n=1 Tax=Gryllus longicercus TaxID=2509291 RepID=A0AAN9VR57_9ORTH
MKLSHFKKYFTHFWLAAPFPDFGDCFQTTSRQMYVLCNSWETGRSAGGSNLENADEFLKNPQYVLTVEEADGQLQTLCESEKDIAPTCDVVIQLIQEQNRGKFSKKLHTIGITVFQIGGRFPKRLTADNVEEFEPLSASVAPTQESCVVARLAVAPGRYVVVPTAEEVDISRRFLLRVYSRKPIQFQEEKPFQHGALRWRLR